MMGNSMPLVSFVIPCYNYARYLGDCLQSIFCQEGNYEFEVIAVDDGSTDNTQTVLQTFADPRMRIINHPVNMGHVVTINDGIRAAQGTFVARIDPDDRYRPYFLSAVLPKFAAFPEVGLVYGDVALINELGEKTAERSDRVHGGQDFKGNELIRLLEENFICAPTVIARREAWQKALPVPDGLAFHDWYFTVLIAREWEFYYIDRVLADYRVHPANHHCKVIRNKTEEPSLFYLLDRVFGETEKIQALEQKKQKAKHRIYGAHYLTLADKYFGFFMNTDARRCYLKTIRYQPQYFLRFAVLRRLLATVCGRRLYEWLKVLVKKKVS
jgi:glycosyltransferase involved in cell wall biosynthesis